MTTVASGFCTSAPAPVAIAIHGHTAYPPATSSVSRALRVSLDRRAIDRPTDAAAHFGRASREEIVETIDSTASFVKDWISANQIAGSLAEPLRTMPIIVHPGAQNTALSRPASFLALNGIDVSII